MGPPANWIHAPGWLFMATPISNHGQEWSRELLFSHFSLDDLKHHSGKMRQIFYGTAWSHYIVRSTESSKKHQIEARGQIDKLKSRLFY
jgi:hypothetical protein